MDIEAIVKKHISLYRVKGHHSIRVAMRAALTELSAAHAIELRAYEATVQNQAERIRQLEAERVPDGWKLVPTEATTDMVKAGMMVGDVGLYAIYGVMIDAAPAKEGE